MTLEFLFFFLSRLLSVFIPQIFTCNKRIFGFVSLCHTVLRSFPFLYLIWLLQNLREIMDLHYQTAY